MRIALLPLGLVILSLTVGCSSQMSNDKAAELYLSKACPSNAAMDRMIEAFNDQDQRAFEASLDESVLLLSDFVVALDDSKNKWPDAISSDIAEMAELSYIQIESLRAMQNSSSLEEADLKLGDYVSASENENFGDDISLVGTKIRSKLGLSADREKSCSGFEN